MKMLERKAKKKQVCGEVHKACTPHSMGPQNKCLLDGNLPKGQDTRILTVPFYKFKCFLRMNNPGVCN